VVGHLGRGPGRIPGLGFSFTVFSRNRDETTQPTTTRTGDDHHMALTICWASGSPLATRSRATSRACSTCTGDRHGGAVLSFGTATIASALYLWRRTRSLAMDRVAHCAMEVSLVSLSSRSSPGPFGATGLGVWWAWTRDSRRRRSSASSHSGTWHFVGPTTTSNCARVQWVFRSSRRSTCR